MQAALSKNHISNSTWQFQVLEKKNESMTINWKDKPNFLDLTCLDSTVRRPNGPKVAVHGLYSGITVPSSSATSKVLALVCLYTSAADTSVYNQTTTKIKSVSDRLNSGITVSSSSATSKELALVCLYTSAADTSVYKQTTTIKRVWWMGRRLV